MVHSTPISIKQTSESIFNFDVSIDLTTFTNFKSITFTSEVTTPLCRDVSSKPKETSTLYIIHSSVASELNKGK